MTLEDLRRMHKKPVQHMVAPEEVQLEEALKTKKGGKKSKKVESAPQKQKVAEDPVVEKPEDQEYLVVEPLEEEEAKEIENLESVDEEF